ncbi:cleavage and polyadenylation specificity factor subunit 1-like [Notothenia coriiceps]|uniref:Cleavage and polyadenylation specificity factor subunit 1-like n=1 Tax=Notothenia coriiceps TaxID=8208 RepID=A0A6I9PCK1_9TELE|nr:PREDICTED: cleavage and polyadenylation specificity factor subunit 1-like [Notothenia coriiceps]
MANTKVCWVAAKESFGGMRLLRRADFNAGANINTFWRMPCRGALEAGSKKALNWDNKHITWFATLDGGVGMLLPMQEKTYRRLLMLQNALNSMLPHHAGLNPKAFRFSSLSQSHCANITSERPLLASFINPNPILSTSQVECG